MTRLHCVRGHGVVIDFGETETTRLTREAVPHHSDGIDGNSMIGKEILHVRFVRGIWKIPHEKLLHFTLLLVNGGYSRETPGGTER